MPPWLLGKLQSYGEWIFGGGYTGVGNGRKLKYARSVFTFCRRPGKGKMAENTKWTKMAMEIGKQIEAGAQSATARAYFGGDFLFDEQINAAAIHDVVVMAGGLLLVGLFTWFHFQSLFLSFVVALQIILSFAVTYFVYRILLDIPKVPIIMLLGIFVIIGIGVDDAFVFFDHLQSEPDHGREATVNAYAVCLTKTLQKTGAAMFVTTSTSACSFASNLASKIPALRIFGLSIAICVVLNFLFVLTIFPAAISMRRSWYRLIRPAIDGVKKRSLQAGTAMANRMEAGSAPSTQSQTHSLSHKLNHSFIIRSNYYKFFYFYFLTDRGVHALHATGIHWLVCEGRPFTHLVQWSIQWSTHLVQSSIRTPLSSKLQSS